MRKRITFKLDNTVQVFRYGKTVNAKISDGTEQILQTYTFSREQYDYIGQHQFNGTKGEMSEFFQLDNSACGNCPLSSNKANNGNGTCYTHKYQSYSGFVQMLKSINREYPTYAEIPDYSTAISLEIQALAIKTNYTRFGTYGEPSMHPYSLVGAITILSKKWTGYTHQWLSKPDYLDFFMASVHSESTAAMVGRMEVNGIQQDFRSFVATSAPNESAVSCPASIEAGFKSNCAKCGLCSGIQGKGKKSVHILLH